jgi:HTH-type transcriptional regulator, sugar sensing transcriptional regulator
MLQIPRPLIDSFTGLGLMESEAKIYTTIVLLHKAEAKDLVECLDLSKPSIYAGLRSLEGRGMIMLTKPKPSTYQAIPPEIALELIMTLHQNRKDMAIRLIHDLENDNQRDNPPAPLWYTLDSKSFDSKIKDMLENASEKIYCSTSGKYLDLIESKAHSDLSFQLIILSRDNRIQKRLELIFKKSRAQIQTIKKSQVLNTIVAMEAGDSQDKKQPMIETLNIFDFDHAFVLIVDDQECFYIPPIPDGSSYAMTTKNKAMILNIKLMMRLLAISES